MKNEEREQKERNILTNFQVSDWTNPAIVEFPGTKPRPAQLQPSYSLPQFYSMKDLDYEEIQSGFCLNDAKVGAAATEVDKVFQVSNGPGEETEFKDIRFCLDLPEFKRRV